MTTCATSGHLWSSNGWCVMCSTPKPKPQRSATPVSHIFPGHADRTTPERVRDLWARLDALQRRLRELEANGNEGRG